MLFRARQSLAAVLVDTADEPGEEPIDDEEADRARS
jgi:hypothetical protein